MVINYAYSKFFLVPIPTKNNENIIIIIAADSQDRMKFIILPNLGSAVLTM